MSASAPACGPRTYAEGDWSSRSSHSFAIRQSLLTVSVDTCSASAVSSLLREKAATEEIRNLWIARNDARNYIVVGDPAVRLRVEAMKAIASSQ